MTDLHTTPGISRDPVRSLDLEGLGEDFQTHVHKVEDGVRARPLISVAAALLAGFVIGRMLRD